MSIERIIRMFAGSLVLISILLGAELSPMYQSTLFLWVAVFVGANLLQSSFTQWCLLEIILMKLGFKTSRQLGE